MDIYLTPSGGSRIQFPMLPEAITMGADAKFMTYSIISLGDVKLPRGQGTKEISWSGMFPGAVRKKNRLVRKYTKPDTLIKNLEKYRDNGTKCTLLCTDTCINYSVYVSSFKGKYKGGSGDYFYDIKFIIARDIKIYTTNELKIKAPTRPSPQNRQKDDHLHGKIRGLFMEDCTAPAGQRLQIHGNLQPEQGQDKESELDIPRPKANHTGQVREVQLSD